MVTHYVSLLTLAFLVMRKRKNKFKKIQKTRYDLTYKRLAEREIDQGVIDLKTFMDRLVQQGVPREKIQEMLLADVENEGPIFEKFFRSLEGASINSVDAAYKQSINATEASFNEIRIAEKKT